MKRRLILLATLLAALIAGATPGHAQRIAPAKGSAPQAHAQSGLGGRIVAVVNDNIISSTDLNARIAMAFLSSGLPDTPEVRGRLLVQILHQMVDEQLEMQEAKKLDITVPPAEIDQALTHIAQENHIPGGDMKAFLTSRGIPPEALMNQIKASLSWNKVIQRELRPRVDIGDDEVDAVIERQKANAGKQEFLVSEVFLSVDNPKDEEQVKQFATNLVQQLRAGGNFGAVARQFSQNASAAAGGDIGWIQEGQLAPELNKALIALKPGEVTDPVRSASGYHLLGLRDKRTIAVGGASAPMVELQQAFRPFGAAAEKPALLKEATRLRSTVSGCVDLRGQLAKGFPDWRWQDLGEVKLSAVPTWIADKTRDLPIGKPSEALEVNKGALILFVCNRKQPEQGGKIDREAITDQIGTEKLELQARGLLRDLRRDAYLDIRLGNGA